MNTVANTAGAAVAGAQAHVLFGDAALIWFSRAFTLCVLFFSEIMPKIVGVAYSRPVSRAVAKPWAAGIAMLFPVIWLIDRLTRVLKPEHSLSAPEEEVNQLAMISAEEGSIMPYEADLVRNVLHLVGFSRAKRKTRSTISLATRGLPTDLRWWVTDVPTSRQVRGFCRGPAKERFLR